MKAETVIASLASTGIRMEEDFAVPINGKPLPLPYMIVRKGENINGSDNGKALIAQISWVVALFSTNKNEELERKILRALAPVGSLSIDRFPDGTPYQTNFEFTTKQVLG